MNPEHPSPEPADDDRLPCGADLDEIQSSGAAPDGHEDCPYCRDALGALHALDDLVRHALESESDPGRSTASITDRIMRTVRTELRPGPLVPMGEEAEDLWVTHAAAAKALRAVVDALPGIRAGGCRITPLGEPVRARSGRLPRGPLHLWLEIAISPDCTVPQAAELVREALMDAATGQFGLTVHGIEVAVIDLIAPDPTGDPRRTEPPR